MKKTGSWLMVKAYFYSFWTFIIISSKNVLTLAASPTLNNPISSITDRIDTVRVGDGFYDSNAIVCRRKISANLT